MFMSWGKLIIFKIYQFNPSMPLLEIKVVKSFWIISEIAYRLIRADGVMEWLIWNHIKSKWELKLKGGSCGNQNVSPKQQRYCSAEMKSHRPNSVWIHHMWQINVNTVCKKSAQQGTSLTDWWLHSIQECRFQSLIGKLDSMFWQWGQKGFKKRKSTVELFIAEN